MILLITTKGRGTSQGRKKMIQLNRFPLKSELVAPNIYGRYLHRTTDLGVLVPEEHRSELRRFLHEFLRFSGYPEKGVYLRVDAFMNQGQLQIIEINAHFVDGWGIALNLARAAGRPVELNGASFPEIWTTSNEIYRPELELACQELTLQGYRCRTMPYDEVLQRTDTEVYWYGRFNRYRDYPLVRPTFGQDLDNKYNLARFSWQWESALVEIPLYYSQEVTDWDELPRNVVFKFCDKAGPEVARARSSVLYRDQIGKGKFVRQCYRAETAVAQEVIRPTRLDDGSLTQLIVMAAGSEPLTGYLQVVPAGTRIINDNSTHGPLIFDC